MKPKRWFTLLLRLASSILSAKRRSQPQLAFVNCPSVWIMKCIPKTARRVNKQNQKFNSLPHRAVNLLKMVGIYPTRLRHASHNSVEFGWQTIELRWVFAPHCCQTFEKRWAFAPVVRRASNNSAPSPREIIKIIWSIKPILLVRQCYCGQTGFAYLQLPSWQLKSHDLENVSSQCWPKLAVPNWLITAESSCPTTYLIEVNHHIIFIILKQNWNHMLKCHFDRQGRQNHMHTDLLWETD